MTMMLYPQPKFFPLKILTPRGLTHSQSFRPRRFYKAAILGGWNFQYTEEFVLREIPSELESIYDISWGLRFQCQNVGHGWGFQAPRYFSPPIILRGWSYPLFYPYPRREPCKKAEFWVAMDTMMIYPQPKFFRLKKLTPGAQLRARFSAPLIRFKAAILDAEIFIIFNNLT